jgi:peptide/nickel transport system ATP-binding protein
MGPILKLENLQTHFFTKAGVLKAVDGVSFEIGAGETAGLVGESGSGKSITGFSIMGLVDAPGRIVGGQILFKGDDITKMTPAQLQSLRGNRIAMIFQDPMMTLNPVLRIETQMIESIQAHDGTVTNQEAWERSRDALGLVGISSPEERMRAYPHQFSGGMRQRVSIAIAMLNRPDLIIADEPTTALDVTIQGQVIYEMQRLCHDTRTALLWITHDLAVVAGIGH